MKKSGLKTNRIIKKKNYLPLFMSLCLIGTLHPAQVQAENKTIKNINLDTAVLCQETGWEKDSHKITFGSYQETSLNYRVLHSDEDGLLLDCDTVLEIKKFDDNSNAWGDSSLKTWLGTAELCDTAEKSAVTSDRITILTDREAADYYKNTDARKKTGSSNEWWLRTTDSTLPDLYTGVVSDGVIDQYYVDTEYVGVSPALRLNPEKILFVSEKNMDKAVSLRKPAESTAKEWKLTLLTDSISAAVTEGKKVTAAEENGNTEITVSYTCSGDASQISVMLTDQEYSQTNASLLYYGKLAQVTESNKTGTAEFTLPNGYKKSGWGTEYQVYLIAEKVNGSGTDYASAPVKLSLSDEEDNKEESSVTITWQDMQFSYSKGTWDFKEHVWKGGGWTANEGCGSVTIKNTGETAVNAGFTFAPEEGEDVPEVSAVFTEDGKEFKNNSLQISASQKKTVTLGLTGKAPADYIAEKMKIGTVCITLSAEE